MADLQTILRRFCLWAVVCVVSAAPSFMWASQGFHRGAMAVGVVLFILAYTALTSTATFERFHDRPFVRRTLYIGYGARLTASVLFPLGMGLDMFPGMLSLALVKRTLGDPHTFDGTLATTIVQGTILNILLTLFMLVVYAVQARFMQPPPARPGFEVVMPAMPIEAR